MLAIRTSKMTKPIIWLFGISVAAATFGYAFILPGLGQTAKNVDLKAYSADVERGAYVLRMGGCVVCHTDIDNGGVFLAGGAGLETPFGTFYAPNITPDTEHGIGAMSLEDFYVAMTAGVTPDGEHYFPSFPYTSYGRFKTEDIVDLKAYLDTVEPVATPSPPHELIWPFSSRQLVGVWKSLYHTPEPFIPDEAESASWNRGAYLVNGPGHCGECHTARNLIGGISTNALEGAGKSSFSSGAPAIAGSRSTIRDWSLNDLVFYLQLGLTPDGDVSGGKMIDVIEHGTSHLTGEDLEAIATYLRSL